MSLSRRLIWTTLLSMTFTGMLGAAALIGMGRINTHFDIASDQYDQLRSLYEIGHRAAVVRLLLAEDTPNRALVERNLAAAILELEVLRTKRADTIAASQGGGLQHEVASINDHLQSAARRATSDTDLKAVSADINQTLARIATLAGRAKAGIIENRQLAAARLTTTIQFMGVLFGATILAGIMAGIIQHRSVMAPLRSISRAVAKLSQADFDHRIQDNGPREFRLLIRRFNQMSAEIDRLHTSMCRQVESKSRQLVRSEQLARVGYLAAGLAHEINNPLAIIAGYAESTLKHMRCGKNGLNECKLRVRTEQVLSLICEEAFRCRNITGDLLEMAQPRGERYEPVTLSSAVQRAATLVRGLPVAHDKDIVISENSAAEELFVRGDESQLVQVLTNLITNGLEACKAKSGRVTITILRENDNTLAIVADNGCGMGKETLTHAFDPFFTDKAHRGLCGSGLGLSVSRAIAERHGGRLYAHSDGPDRGSTFIFELPIMIDGKAVLHACA